MTDSTTRSPAARPQLSDAQRAPTCEVSAVDETGARLAVAIAGEHPLTLYVDRREVVTLMTLGQAPEALALGFLRNQRLLRSLDEVASVQVDWSVEAAAVTTRTGQGLNAEGEASVGAPRTVTTGCGQGSVFGDLMAEVDRIRLPAEARLTRAGLQALLEAVRRRETVYKQAGAVHGCALARCTQGEAEVLHYIEDVGRHNAVDAIAGLMWLHGQEGADKVFYTTGRLTSEMVIKCAQMGIPILVSRSGLTAMGLEVARQVGLTLIGRATHTRFLLFSGEERFLP